jgi:hypothetical protein
VIISLFILIKSKIPALLKKKSSQIYSLNDKKKKLNSQSHHK